jgi:hypothetical protein
MGRILGLKSVAGLLSADPGSQGRKCRDRHYGAQDCKPDLAFTHEGCRHYQWARPAFVAMKMRKLELRTGASKAHGRAGPGHDYWIKELRYREMGFVANAKTSARK